MNAELYVWYEALPEHEGRVQSGFAALLRIVQSSPDIEATLNASSSVDESRVARARLLKRADRVKRECDTDTGSLTEFIATFGDAASSTFDLDEQRITTVTCLAP